MERRRLVSFGLILALLLIVGAFGSLACGQATLKEFQPGTAPTPDYTWKTGVIPVFAAHDCAQPACHSQTTKAGQLILDPTMNSSLLYTLVVTSGGTLQRAGTAKEADTTVPLNSLLITKPTNTYSPGGHTGGPVIQVDTKPGSDYEILLHWIQAGAQND